MRSDPAQHRPKHAEHGTRRGPARHGSMLANLLPGLLSLAVVFAAVSQASAQGQAGSMPSADAMKAALDEQLDQIPSGEAGVSMIMGELTKQLELSASQQTEIEPIITGSVASMEKIRDRYKAGEISPMALGMQMQMAGQKAATQVEPLLTPAQLEKYTAMRQEQRRQMMKAMQQAQSAGKAPAPGAAQ
jgi:hypothetical protein